MLLIPGMFRHDAIELVHRAFIHSIPVKEQCSTKHLIDEKYIYSNKADHVMDLASAQP